MVKSTPISSEKAVKTAGKKPPAPAAQHSTKQRDGFLLQNLQRGVLPANLHHADILQLQRTIGNRAVGGLLRGSAQARSVIQAKLVIGQPADQYEQEADRVAAQVVAQINAPTSSKPSQEQPEQRQVLSGKQLQTKPVLQLHEAIQGGEASTHLESAINRSKGGGQPLDAGLQQSMGLAMEADFSGVRLHTDAQADQFNQSIQAKAFTTGQDVFFRDGAYDPGSREGQALIAHELTHVVQQNAVSARQTSQATFGTSETPAFHAEKWSRTRNTKNLRELSKYPYYRIEITNSSKNLQAYGGIKGTEFKGEEGGVDYDSSKLEELKTIEMKKWKELLPGLKDAEDFTWHHIVPQSRISDKNTASDKSIVRLGPSTSVRIGDPGNDYTDPNFEPTGSLTPISEEIENAIGKNRQSELNPEELTTILKNLALVNKAKEEKSYSNPDIWHIPKVVLLDLINGYEGNGVTKEVKDDMKKLVNDLSVPVEYINYKKKELAKNQEEAVPLSKLHKDIIKDPKMWSHFDNAIYKKPAFVRGYVLDPESQERHRIKDERVIEAMTNFKNLVNSDDTLKEEIKKAELDLLKKKEFIMRYDQMFKQVCKVIKGPAGEKPSGTEFKYFLGQNVALDKNKLKKAMESISEFKEKFPKDPKVKQLINFTLSEYKDENDLIGKLNIPWQKLDDESEKEIKKSVALSEERREEILQGLPKYEEHSYPTKRIFSKNEQSEWNTSIKKNSALKYPMTEEENKELMTAVKKKEPDNPEGLKTLRETIKERGQINKDQSLEDFINNELQKKVDEEIQDKVNLLVKEKEIAIHDESIKKEIAIFRLKQDKRLRKLNDKIVAFNLAYEVKPQSLNIDNYVVLKQFWPDMNKLEKGLATDLRYKVQVSEINGKELEQYSSTLKNNYEVFVKDHVNKVITVKFKEYINSK